MRGWKSWRGDLLLRNTRREMGRALLAAGESTLAESQKQVPLDEGTLQESGIVKTNPSEPLDVVISYGGGPGTGFPLVPYARRWHETPANFQHNRKHNYLRDPLKEHAPGAVEKALKKAGERVW